MQKAVVIGGRGKVGGYLAPLLVGEGFEVVTVSRGKTAPYGQDGIWERIGQVNLDRNASGFEEGIRSLKPDVVVDMICFEAEAMRRLVDALRGQVAHYLVCGSVWMHGCNHIVPCREDECREPLEEYGVQKSLIDYAIRDEYLKNGFPGTAVHPGHIVCPGDVPINPQGWKGLAAFETLKEGKPLYLPNFGMETLHHVHAKDVAGVFLAAVKAGAPSFGQGFHATSPRAVTLRGYAQEVAGWYGKKADLRFEGFDAWRARVGDDIADQTWTHITHSPASSMEKARALLGFTPEYTSYEAVRECVASFGL